MVITRVDVYWPVSSPSSKLHVISLGGALLLDDGGGIQPPSVPVCTSGCTRSWYIYTTVTDRTIGPRGPVSLSFGFSRAIPYSTVNPYVVTVTFEHGCAITQSKYYIP